MLLKKSNRSYYRYQTTYRIHKADKTKEIRKSKWNTDILYHQLHFWNKKQITRTLETDFFRKLIIKEKDITHIEVLEAEIVLVSKYACEVY